MLKRTGPQIGPPGPTGQVHLDGRTSGHHPGRSVAAHDHRTQVARLQSIARDQLTRRIDELIDGVRHLHAVDLARHHQSREMLPQSENGRTLRGAVRPDALKGG